MHNAGKWTTARMHSFIKSALRSASQRWPPKFEALKAAKRGKKVNNKTGRIAEHYLCCECGGEFPAKDVQVDHINAVINPNTGFTSWDDVIIRMFCEIEGYQILCKPCHKAKSNIERCQAKERKSINDTSK
jgi:5-methylcytosine-specific restriction endonuclease McrA